MSPEPGNAASEAAERFVAILADPARTADLAAVLSDGFVYNDRRKVIGLSDVDKATFIEGVVPFQHEIGVESSDRFVMAVRGERLLLTRLVNRYRDGSEREYLALSEFDDSVSMMVGLTHFDVDDHEAAMAELERLHAESSSG